MTEMERNARKEREQLLRLMEAVRSERIDPDVLLNALLPEAWANYSIDAFEFTVRVKNCFQGGGIYTMAALGLYTPSRLFKLQNFGRKSLSDVYWALARKAASEIEGSTELQEAVEQLRAPVSEVVHGPAAEQHGLPSVLFMTSEGKRAGVGDTLVQAVDRFMNSLPPRSRVILEARLGFNATPLTLQETGTLLGVTRERVRQIAAKAWMKAEVHFKLVSQIETKLAAVYSNRIAPLTMEALEAEDGWFAGILARETFYFQVMKACVRHQLTIVQVAGLRVLVRGDSDSIERACRSARDLGRIAATHKWTRSEYEIAVAASLEHAGLAELRYLVLGLVSDWVHIASADGVATVVGFGRSVEQMTNAVLSESATPLHYSEIRKRIRSRYGESVDERQISNRATRFGAYLLDRGTYGLERHLTLNAEERLAIRGLLESVIASEGRDRQWHSVELADIAMESFPQTEGRIDQYQVNALLRGTEHAVYLGRSVWIGTNSEAVSVRERIDVNEAFVSILRESGKPMHADELMATLRLRRGVSRVCQVRPDHRMIAIQPGVWALVGRDVMFSTPSIESVFDQLESWLESFGRGADLDDLTDMMASRGWDWGRGVSPYALVSIASTSKRFGVTYGPVLYLSGWGSPRYVAIRERIEGIVNSGPLPITLDAICRSLMLETGKEVKKDRIYSHVRALGLTYSEAQGGWLRLDLDNNEGE